MRLHNSLENEDCIGRKVTADIPIGLEWVDYPNAFEGGVITSDGVEVNVPNYDHRDVYVEGGLLAFCQGEVCEIRAYDAAAETVTLQNNDPKRSRATSGDNATEFTIPYDWYTACFGTDWNLIDVQLQGDISSTKLTLLSMIERYSALHGADKAFDELCSHLQGYNRDDELFDFTYAVKHGGYDIISTVTYRDGVLGLADDCEVWHGSIQLETSYNWQPQEASAIIVGDDKSKRTSILDLELARRAHNANSFREYNGERIQAEYNSEVSEVAEIGEQQKQRLAKLYPGVDLSDEYAKIDRLVSSFSSRLEDHYNKGFAIEASCPSIMISGGSNFPTRKKEKQNAARERHNAEYKEIKSIINCIEAVGTSIRGNDENAVDKLQVKITQLKDEQTRAKVLNAYYRKNGTVKGFNGVSDDEAARIDTEVKNAHSWARQPFPDYHLTSINNRIKEAERRLQDLQPQTDLAIKLELEIGYYSDSLRAPIERAPLTLENLAEHQAKLDESKGSAFVSGKVFAGERHTKIGEWVYSRNSSDVWDYTCVDLKDAVSRGVSGGTVNKKIIADCWDAFLHGNTRTERQAERLDGADTIGGGTIRLEEGRINIYFNGKPAADVISKLKSNAFKWSPSRVAWTRQDTPNARFAVKSLLEAEKPSVLDAIRADRENPRQPGTKIDKAKSRDDGER